MTAYVQTISLMCSQWLVDCTVLMPPTRPAQTKTANNRAWRYPSLQSTFTNPTQAHSLSSYYYYTTEKTYTKKKREDIFVRWILNYSYWFTGCLSLTVQRGLMQGSYWQPIDVSISPYSAFKLRHRTVWESRATLVKSCLSQQLGYHFQIIVLIH